MLLRHVEVDIEGVLVVYSLLLVLGVDVAKSTLEHLSYRVKRSRYVGLRRLVGLLLSWRCHSKLRTILLLV